MNQKRKTDNFYSIIIDCYSEFELRVKIKANTYYIKTPMWQYRESVYCCTGIGPVGHPGLRDHYLSKLVEILWSNHIADKYSHSIV